MSMSDADKLARAYAHLTAIRKTVVDMGAANIVVGSGMVEQYADALLHLQDIGQDVDEFKLPDDRIEYTDTGKPYVDRPLFLARLVAIIGYFQLTQGQAPNVIGFKGSRKP
jgi:hypothetical protein